MARLDSKRIQDVFEHALYQYNNIQSTVFEVRKQCLLDRRFYSISGAQWEDGLFKQFENRPRFEFNKIHLSIMKIISEYRNNRIDVAFLSKDGSDDDNLAETCAALYRADEERSSAQEAYDNAFEEAVGGGFGAWRLTTEYYDDGDPDDDRQRICIEPIYDADRFVFFDLQAKRQDKSDAQYCFIVYTMTPEAFQEEWGYDKDPSTWPSIVQEYVNDWYTEDVINIAEYYRIEEVKEKIFIYELLNGEEERIREEELTDEKLLYLEATGATEIRIKTVRRRKVRKYIMSGAGILDDCGYIAGDCIPIVPVYGKRWYVDNLERCMGHVRLAKDAQRLKNMQLSRLAEISALSPLEKPIFYPEQISNYQNMWQQDNIQNNAFLVMGTMTDRDGNQILAPPPAFSKPPSIPPALGALLETTERDIQDILGNTTDGEKIEGNISTETAMLIQNRLDMQTYIYVSNMAKAIKRSGEIWLSMARDILIEEGRKIKGIGSHDSAVQIELMKPIIGKSGVVEYENDLSQAKYDVIVSVGPASITRKQATIRTLLQLLPIVPDPQMQQVLSSMIILNMEGEGMQDVRKYFREQLVKIGALAPTQEEEEALKQQMANSPPPAQEQYLRAAAAAEQAKSVKAQADTIWTQARADETRAKTAEILANISSKEQEQAFRDIEALQPRVVPPGVEQ